MKARIFLAVIALILCSWSMQTGNIKKAEWLIGTWENKTSRGSVYEQWKKSSNIEFTAKSYALKGSDTIVFESIRLTEENSGLFYIPVVKNQNQGMPVRFALKKISDKEIIFENPQHDFPQLISYTRISNDSLVAEISGTKNGQQRRQSFKMKKVH